jgi:DNA-binding NarL/FixJ family response regulator
MNEQIIRNDELDRSNAIVASNAEIFRYAISSILSQQHLADTVLTTSNWSSVQAHLLRAHCTKLAVINTDVLNGQGHGMMRRLRLSYPHLRIIVVGQTRERMKILSLISAGAHAYILESMPMDEIAKAVRMVAAGHIYLPDMVGDLSAPEPDSVRAEGALTRRQQQVLQLLVGGASNKEIKVHLSGLFKALGVHNRTGAVASVHAQAY